ncbi:MAG: PIN domain-containing protein [Gammaproteobacteria bacterium]|nr:PIN domain-containing protein [Gammaproteobacteria bacterium]
MLFDTDVLIFLERGNFKAKTLVEKTHHKGISTQTQLELLQGARSKKEQKNITDFLLGMDFTIYPLTEKVGHRALIYIEEYALGHGLRAADAIIAATASENNCVLIGANQKHYKAIAKLVFKPFKP